MTTYSFMLCVDTDGARASAVLRRVEGIVSATPVGTTNYRRVDLPDLHLIEVETTMRPIEAVRVAVGVLREKGYQAFRYIPRGPSRKNPASSPKLNLLPEELERAVICATLDGAKPTGRSGGLPELVTYFIQLLNDRYAELEGIYGKGELRNVDPDEVLSASTARSDERKVAGACH